jgi:hypothetical protein
MKLPKEYRCLFKGNKLNPEFPAEYAIRMLKELLLRKLHTIPYGLVLYNKYYIYARERLVSASYITTLYFVAGTKAIVLTDDMFVAILKNTFPTTSFIRHIPHQLFSV